jgi:hypothetical protein
MYSWEDLAARALARQFPDVPGREVDSVARALHLIGPIQAQTARSPFLALAARMPGVTLETVSAAYDGHRIVRGSNIRGGMTRAERGHGQWWRGHSAWCSLTDIGSTNW